MTDRARHFEDLMREELALWPGAVFSFGIATKHRFIEVGFGEETRKAFFPCTTGDYRAALNALKDVRRALRECGATRSAPAKSGHAERKHHHRRSQPGGIQPRPGDPVVRPDTWFGPLAAIRQQMETV